LGRGIHRLGRCGIEKRGTEKRGAAERQAERTGHEEAPRRGSLEAQGYSTPVGEMFQNRAPQGDLLASPRAFCRDRTGRRIPPRGGSSRSPPMSTSSAGDSAPPVSHAPKFVGPSWASLLLLSVSISLVGAVAASWLALPRADTVQRKTAKSAAPSRTLRWVG